MIYYASIFAQVCKHALEMPLSLPSFTLWWGTKAFKQRWSLSNTTQHGNHSSRTDKDQLSRIQARIF